MEDNGFGINENKNEITGDARVEEIKDTLNTEVTVEAVDTQKIEEIENVKNVVEDVVEDVIEASVMPEAEETKTASYAFNNYEATPQERQSTPKPQTYYVENYKKPKEKKSGLGHLILVAVLSAIFGGGVVAAAFLLVAPSIVPSINELLGNTPTQASQGVDRIVQITDSETPVTAIAEKVGPSIVGIKVTTAANSRDFFFDLGPGVGEGSGIIIREDGYIVTNNHVVSGAMVDNSSRLANGAKIEVVLPNQTDKTYPATVVGRDSKTDLAVLKIEGKGFPAAELGDSGALKQGELAVAIGNPGGMDYMGSVTAGIISGLNRTLQTEDNTTLTLIQTDAAINPGNSGGALCNSKGQVIGINTAKIAASGFEGLGFAIPINQVKEISQSLIDFKYVKGRPYLGVSIDQRYTEDYAKQYNYPAGLLVGDVMPLSAAYKAGVKTGDIITSFDGKKVAVFKDLEDQKNKHKPGDVVKMEVYRDDKSITLEVTLGEENNQ